MKINNDFEANLKSVQCQNGIGVFIYLWITEEAYSFEIICPALLVSDGSMKCLGR